MRSTTSKVRAPDGQRASGTHGLSDRREGQDEDHVVWFVFAPEPTTLSAQRFFDRVDRGALALAYRLSPLGVGGGCALGYVHDRPALGDFVLGPGWP
jgi:hypothetical protein